MNKYEAYVIAKAPTPNKTAVSIHPFGGLTDDQIRELYNFISDRTGTNIAAQGSIDYVYTYITPTPTNSEPHSPSGRLAYRIAEETRRGFDRFRDFLGYGQGTARSQR